MQTNKIPEQHSQPKHNELKMTWIDHLNHDMRTPLFSVIGYADLMLSQPFSPEDQKEFIRTIKRNGEAVLRLLELYLSEQQRSEESSTVR